MAKKPPSLPNDEEKQIFIEAFKARKFLFLHGFIPESVNNKLKLKLEKYQDKHEIEVTENELNS